MSDTPYHQPVRATWNLSADAFLEAAAGYTEEARELMLAALRWCIDPQHPVSRDEFARRVGYDVTSVYKFYLNKYYDPETKQPQPPPEKFLSSVRAFMKIERDRFEGGETEFVQTPTAKRIWNLFDLARESSTIAILTGVSHVGKTWAAERYRQENNHGRTLYARMEAASGLGGMVRVLASACGISDKANTADLIKRIKNSLTKDTLLILDEVHLLSNTYRVHSFFSCVEVQREIHDKTRCGMVMIWTRIDSLEQHRDRELQQVWRRGPHKLYLPSAPTRADVSAIVTAAGLTFPDQADAVTLRGVTEKPAEMLKVLAKTEGLKAITERLRYGRKIAAKAREKFAWPHVVLAHLTIEAERIPIKTGWD